MTDNLADIIADDLDSIILDTDDGLAVTCQLQLQEGGDPVSLPVRLHGAVQARFEGARFRHQAIHQLQGLHGMSGLSRAPMRGDRLVVPDGHEHAGTWEVDGASVEHGVVQAQYTRATAPAIGAPDRRQVRP